MRNMWIVLAAALVVSAWAPAAFAGCWCGNGYNDVVTNLVEAQVWPGDNAVTTWMNFIYTTDGSDPFSSGTAQTVAGGFYQFAGNNDWYQAYLTANPGDVVKWYAEAQSADAEVCNSEMYTYTVGEPPVTPPNLVGDCESELTGGGDWDNGDDPTKLWDPDEDGVFELTVTAVADFTAGGGSGYQVVGVSGSWSPQYPGDSNIPTSFTMGEEITYYLDTNAVPGWSPESNAAYDSKLAAGGHIWTAVGDWQGWDPTNTATHMTEVGGGIKELIFGFTAGMAGTHEFKCAADGGWDLQCGTNGYGSNSSTWSFDTAGDECVQFLLDTTTGRIKVVTGLPSGTEPSTWSSIKSMYR